MKKPTFIAVFVVTHVLFIVLQIHKSSQFMHQSYSWQNYEAIKQRLAQKKQELTHQLYICQARTHVKNFAQHNLKMGPIHLSQIQKISLSDSTRTRT